MSRPCCRVWRGPQESGGRGHELRHERADGCPPQPPGRRLRPRWPPHGRAHCDRGPLSEEDVQRLAVAQVRVLQQSAVLQSGGWTPGLQL